MNPNQPPPENDPNKKPEFPPEAGKQNNPGANQPGKAPDTENDRQREQRKASGA